MGAQPWTRARREDLSLASTELNLGLSSSRPKSATPVPPLAAMDVLDLLQHAAAINRVDGDDAVIDLEPTL